MRLSAGTRASRNAWIGVTLGVATLATALVFAAWLTVLRGMDVSIEALRAGIARDQAAIGARSRARVVADAVTEHAPGPERYVRGDSPELARDGLEQHFRALVRTYGGRVREIEIQGPAGPAPPRTMMLHAEFAIAVPGLRRVLYRIEGGAPMLVIERAVLVADGEMLREFRRDPTLGAMVNASLDIRGLRPPATFGE